jgi:hypothetical protein
LKRSRKSMNLSHLDLATALGLHGEASGAATSTSLFGGGGGGGGNHQPPRGLASLLLSKRRHVGASPRRGGVDTGADSGVGAFAMLACDDEGGSRFRGRGGEDEEEDEEGGEEEDGGGGGVSAFPRVASAPLLSRLRGGVAHPRADVAFASFHAFAPAAAASAAFSASSSGLAFPPVPELAASAASAPPVPALSAAGPRSVTSRSASIEDGGIHF